VKALLKARAEPGLWLQDVPGPTFGINDVLIRVHRTGICGTDVHIYDWDSWAQQTINNPNHYCELITFYPLAVIEEKIQETLEKVCSS
jgi:threonine dehydrogenase-like Zn-dependent dehydrogenase